MCLLAGEWGLVAKAAQKDAAAAAEQQRQRQKAAEAEGSSSSSSSVMHICRDSQPEAYFPCNQQELSDYDWDYNKSHEDGEDDVVQLSPGQQVVPNPCPTTQPVNRSLSQSSGLSVCL